MSPLVKRLAIVLVLVLAAAPVPADETFRLTILHTNDRHGHVEMAAYQREESPFSEGARDLGGAARMATVIERIRAGTGNAVVVVDAGDVFGGRPGRDTWYGEPEIEAMNLMGYDMLCVGNHELKAVSGDPVSKEIMLRLMRRSRFPWLAANLTLGDGPPPGCDSLAFVEGIHPFVVRSFEGVRVGFLGLTTADAAGYPHLKGWTVGDPIEAARRWVAEARRDCDIVVAVTHLGLRTDRLLAEKVEGIDVIVGGHSHTFLSEPIAATNPEGAPVPIAQGGDHGVVLGRLDLVFHREGEDGWRLAEAKGELIPIDRSFPESPPVRRLVDRYRIAGERPLEAEPAAAPGALPAPAG